MGNPAGEDRGPDPGGEILAETFEGEIIPFTKARPGKGTPEGRTIRLTFTPEQWAEIEDCAAFDGVAPAAWARESALSWIPETLEAIRDKNLTPEEREAAALEAGRVASAYRLSMVAAELNLSGDEAAAVAICGAWEGVGFAGLCRSSILAFLECSFADMEGFATGAAGVREGVREGGRKEKQWAKLHHKEAAPIMARIGWSGMAIETFPAPLPDHRATGQPGNRETGKPPRLRFPLAKVAENQARNAAGREA